jgi:L-lactate dehydrogenase complex protein LldG
MILDAVRRNRPMAADLPAVEHAWTTYADRQAKFTEVLELVGGQTIVARDSENLNEQLACLPQVASANRIASLVPAVGAANVDLAAIHDPHALANVDVAILPGEFAVAENAAVWVNDRHIPLRVLFFLCQHLVLVVSGGEILDHMHAAYDRLAGSESPPREFVTPMFGAFISGPSKTADIEQSLVIGAHGPRSLVVCFLDRPSRL